MIKNLSSDKLLFWSIGLFMFLVPIAVSPAVIAGGLVIAVWIFSGMFWKDRGWLKQEWTMPVFLFMLLPWVGLIWTSDVHMGLKFAQRSYYWLYAFAAATATGADQSGGRSRALINAFLAGLGVSFIISLFQLAHLLPMGEGNTPTSFVNHMSYTLFLAFAVVMGSFYYRQAGSGRGKLLPVIMMAAFFFNLLIASGRSGYLAFVLISPLIAINIFGKKNALKAALLLAILGVIFFSAPMVRSRIRDGMADLKQLSHGHENTEVGLRVYFWKGAFKIFKKHPLLGAGTGGYGDAMEQFRTPAFPRSVQPHNSFIYMMVSFGVPGIFCIIWLFYVFLKKGCSARSGAVGYSVLMYGIVLIIGSFTDTQILSIATAELFAVMTGLNVSEEPCQRSLFI